MSEDEWNRRIQAIQAMIARNTEGLARVKEQLAKFNERMEKLLKKMEKK